MLGLIESQELYNFIDGETSPPPEMVPASDATPTNPKMVANLEFQAWRRSDRLLRVWITGTLSEDTLSLVIGLDSSQEV